MNCIIYSYTQKAATVWYPLYCIIAGGGSPPLQSISLRLKLKLLNVIRQYA
jgi:hypothetical protein